MKMNRVAVNVEDGPRCNKKMSKRVSPKTCSRIIAKYLASSAVRVLNKKSQLNFVAVTLLNILNGRRSDWVNIERLGAPLLLDLLNMDTRLHLANDHGIRVDLGSRPSLVYVEDARNSGVFTKGD